MRAVATRAADPPRWYWAVVGLAVLWTLVGVSAWVMDLLTDEATLATLTEGQRQLYAARPPWLFVVFGVAIFSGLAGAVGLALRARWAKPALALSLAAVVVQFGYTLLVMPAIELLGPAAAIPFPLTVVAVGALLLWFAVVAERRGWVGRG
jgi:hypothetical protein